ncbi:MAG: TSUP family transporter [Stomatobaculum sp.]|nr:TSUP family transporter [Stomatobaculum sp.]
MHLTPITFLIVCPMVFLAGFVDAIGGGGGLISLPAYLFAGLPVHNAVSTNKLSSCLGTGIATLRFARKKMIRWKLALLTIPAAVAGSAIGAHISLRLNERIMLIILICVLPMVAFAVNSKVLKDRPRESEVLDANTYITAVIAAFVIGMYDGIYGPGTGTFLIIALTIFSRLSMATANGQTKAINFTTNITSLVVFLRSGTVVIPLGLAAALCNMAGAYLGSGMVMEKGSKIVRPILLIVLVLLFIKVLRELLA